MSALEPPAGEPERITPAELLPILEELARLEPDFHQPPEGTPRAALEARVVEDFWEIGASGRRYSREYVMNSLMERAGKPRGRVWDYTDPHLRELAPELYLMTFTLVQDAGRKTQRSSIWRRGPEGWQMVFHQGTVVG